MDKGLEEIFGSYMAWKFAKDTWCISFMNGSEYMYLLEGGEKALLLDTGYGAGNLRAFVETLTDKPLVVANTHIHPDHASGNGEFGKVYMSEGYLLDAPSVYSKGAAPFDLSRLPHPDYEKVFLADGDIIDLGGRKIEIIKAAPAHCSSSLFYLDRSRRMFFCGDELESAQVLMFVNSNISDTAFDLGERLENLKKNTEKIKGISDKIDYLLPNHNGMPLSVEYCDDYIGLVDHIFDGTAAIEDRINHKYIEMDPQAPKLCRVRWKRASIIADKGLVAKEYGKECRS